MDLGPRACRDRLNERADALVHGAVATRSSASSSRGTLLPPCRHQTAAPAAVSQGADLRVDLALGLQITRAAKAAGVTPEALVDDAIRFSTSRWPS